jgi:hypothetical protein
LYRKVGKTLEAGNARFEEVAAHYEKAETALGLPIEEEGPEVWEEWCQIQMEHLLCLYWWQRTEEMASRIAAIQSRVARHGTPLQRATLLSHLSRQTNTQNRFAPSQVGLNYSRAALETLPAVAGLEQRAVYQFSYGINLLWNGEYVEAEAALREALAASELTGDIALQARVLAYLLAVARRRGFDEEVASIAQRGLAVAESTHMHNYIGAALAGMSWVAWRAGSMVEAEQLARSALQSWKRFEQVYPLQWQALWPLLGIALERGQVGEAIGHASAVLRPDQQALPDALAGPLVEGLAAWAAGQEAMAREHLARALAAARLMNYT